MLSKYFLLVTPLLLVSCAVIDRQVTEIPSTTPAYYSPIQSGLGTNSIHIHPLLKLPKSKIDTTSSLNEYRLTIEGFTNPSGVLSMRELCQQIWSDDIESCIDQNTQAHQAFMERYDALFSNKKSAWDLGKLWCTNVSSRMNLAGEFSFEDSHVGLALGSMRNNSGSLVASTDYPANMIWTTSLDTPLSLQGIIPDFKDTNPMDSTRKDLTVTKPIYISNQLYFTSTGAVKGKRISTNTFAQGCTSGEGSNSVIVHLDDYKKIDLALPYVLRFKGVGNKVVLHRQNGEQIHVPYDPPTLREHTSMMPPYKNHPPNDMVFEEVTGGFLSVNLSYHTLQDTDYLEILP